MGTRGAVGRGGSPDSGDGYEEPTPTEVAYSAALYQAYFATGLEQTKSILLLASAGVGLSMTLLFSDRAKPITSWVPVWLLLAAVGFGVSALLCVWVFRLNAQLVAKLVHEEDDAPEDAKVRRIHRASLTAFALGLVLLLFAGVAQVWL